MPPPIIDGGGVMSLVIRQAVRPSVNLRDAISLYLMEEFK